MASPVIWPGAYYFYPLGNTPAVNLNRDVGFDDDADILLLGCGDPRNILFTVFNEPVKSTLHAWFHLVRTEGSYRFSKIRFHLL